MYLSVKHDNPRYFLALFYSVLWNLLCVKDTILWRRRIRSFRRVSDYAIRRVAVPPSFTNLLGRARVEKG
jgi:hypothetical protein